MTLLNVLEAAGVVVLVIVGVGAIVAVGVGWAVLRRVVRRAGAGALAAVPDEVRLDLLPEASWPDAALAGRLLAELGEEGFTLCGTYRVRPLEGQQVTLLAGRDRRSAAAVVCHPQGGTWVDLWAVDAAGNGVTYTTSRDVGALDLPPWTRRVARPRATVAELATAFRRDVPEDAAPMTCADLPGHFAAEWRRETAWRKRRGVSLREIAAVALRSPRT